MSVKKFVAGFLWSLLAVCTLGHPIVNEIPNTGTDAGLYSQDFFEGDILLAPQARNAVTDRAKLWPSATIIYKVNANVGCPYSKQCGILHRAIEHYHENSCIRFKERSNEANWVDIFFSDDSGACWSSVGMFGGMQRLSLGQRCWYLGIVIHELGHAIGFWHEMNRPDRDQHISINWNNIISGYSTAFMKQGDSETNLLGEPFDYTSVMMYDELAFSKDGVSETLRPRKAGVTIGPIWKKFKLSVSDVRRLHKLYNCPSNDPMPGFPLSTKCNFHRDVCGFTNGMSEVWKWKKSEGYVYTSIEETQYTRGVFLSLNQHSTSAPNAEGCARFWYHIDGHTSGHLKLSQAYLQKVTQLFLDPNEITDLWVGRNRTRWIGVQVPIAVDRPFKLIFESYFDSNANEGSIGLSNIEILYAPCPAPKATTEHSPKIIEFETNQPTGTMAFEWTTDSEATETSKAIDTSMPGWTTDTEFIKTTNDIDTTTAELTTETKVTETSNKIETSLPGSTINNDVTETTNDIDTTTPESTTNSEGTETTNDIDTTPILTTGTTNDIETTMAESTTNSEGTETTNDIVTTTAESTTNSEGTETTNDIVTTTAESTTNSEGTETTNDIDTTTAESTTNSEGTETTNDIVTTTAESTTNSEGTETTNDIVTTTAESTTNSEGTETTNDIDTTPESTTETTNEIDTTAESTTSTEVTITTNDIETTTPGSTTETEVTETSNDIAILMPGWRPDTEDTETSNDIEILMP